MKKNSFNPAAEEAYWITPAGEIFPVVRSHIDMIFDDPELFEVTAESIVSVYDRYNEEYRTECKAREEILLMLFERGWIRARRYLRPYRWSVNIYRLNKISTDNLKRFALLMIDKGHSIHDDVLLDTAESRGILTLHALRIVDM